MFIARVKSVLALNSIDWKKNESLLACCSNDSGVKIIDMREGKIAKTVTELTSGGTEFVYFLSFNYS